MTSRSTLAMLSGVPPPPPGYESLPSALLDTLYKSYTSKTTGNYNLVDAMGWPPGASTASSLDFKSVLDELNRQGKLIVITDVFNRCTAIPGLWQYVEAVRWTWDYAQGNQVSKGFAFTTRRADPLYNFLKGSSKFCLDHSLMDADHQKDQWKRDHGRWCLREVITSAGEGLHVCVVRPAWRSMDAEGGEHDIHIDKHQIVCRRQPGIPGLPSTAGPCIYVGIAQHLADVLPYYAKKLGLTTDFFVQVLTKFDALVDRVGTAAVTASDIAAILKSEAPSLPDSVAEALAGWLLNAIKSYLRRLTRP